MIPFASQRGGGQDLATHLLNAYDNEITEVAHIRGAIAGDLHGAFKEWEAQAEALTRCDKYLYSLSINPDPRQGPLTREQYMDYIGRTEDMLGLKDQPRAVVFHTKYGREHCHVVWSRIDADQQRAVHLAFDHDKLMRVTRAFARDHHLTLPAGYDKSRQVGQDTLYEREQARQTGLTKVDHMRQVTEAWQQSDDARSFVQALASRGYILATGKRPYVLVDLYGNSNALPKLIDDKAVRTADIRAFLERDYPPSSLPSVEEAEKLVAAHRKLVEREVSENRYADRLAALKQGQQQRRAETSRERARLSERQHHARLAQNQQHRAQRDALRRSYRQAVKEVRARRDRDRPTGLAAFLGRVSGVDLIRKAVHRHQDGQRLKAYHAESQALRTSQVKEMRALEARVQLQAKELERKETALARVEQRELAAFMRDERREQHIRDRSGDDRMPSLAQIDGPHLVRDPGAPHELGAAFEQAQTQQAKDPPDLLVAFKRAAKGRDSSSSGDGASSALDRARPPLGNDPVSPDLDRGRDR